MTISSRLGALALLLSVAARPLSAQTITTIGGNPARSGVAVTEIALTGGAAATIDAAGAVYVATTSSVYRVVSGQVTLIAGTGLAGPTVAGSTALATEFANIADIAVDAAGNLFVADQSQARVYRVRAADGIVEVFAGGGISQGVPVPAADLRLTSAAAVELDATGGLLIDDGSRIYRVNLATRLAVPVAGTGANASTGDGGPATAAAVQCVHIAVDAAGAVYCAGAGRIRKFTIGGTIATIAGTGVAGSTGDGGPALAAQIDPFKVTVRGSTLFFAEAFRVRRVDLVANTVQPVAGTGVEASTGDGGPATAAQLERVGGLAALPAGPLFIVEEQKLRAVDGAGVIATVAFNGVDHSGLGGPVLAAQIAPPGNLARDAAGNLYFTSFTRVFRVTPGGTITHVFGTSNGGSLTPGTPAVNVGFNVLGGIAVDDVNGRLYVTSPNIHRIARVNLATGLLDAVFGGTSAFAGDDVALGTVTRFASPRGLLVHGGFLYIADSSNHRIRRVDLATNIITTVVGNGTNTFSGDFGPPTSAGLPLPQLVTATPSGDVLIVSSNRIRRAAFALNQVFPVAGTGASGIPAEGGIATQQPVPSATGLAAGADGTVYVSGNDKVFAIRSNVVQTFAGTGEFVQAGPLVTGEFSGDGGPAALAALNVPRGLLFDAAGRLVVADNFNRRLRRIEGVANPPPSMTSLADVTVPEDTVVPIPFTIGDDTTPVAALALSATTSQASVVALSGLVFTGSGASRTLTVTPVANAVGSTVITVRVLDAGSGLSQRSFVFRVTAVNDPPVLDPIADVAGGDMSPLTRTLTFADVDGPDIVFSVASSNTAVMPVGNLAITGPILGPRTLTLTPVPGSVGVSTVTVRLSDSLLFVERSFTVTIDRTPGAPVMTSATIDGSVAEVRWTAPPPGVTPTGYRVEAGPTPGDATESVDVDPRARRFALELPSTGDWFVRVRTLNGVAPSLPSNEQALTVTGTPGRPRDFTATLAGSLVTFRWTPPTNGARTGYQLQAGSASGLTNLATFVLSPTATAFPVTAPNGTFFVRLVALNGAGASTPSNEVRLVVGGAPAVPAAPTDVEAAADGATAVFRWAAPASGGIGTGVVLDAGTASGLGNLVTGLPIGNAFTFVATAPPGTHFVRLRAVNVAGSSAPSTEMVLTIPDGGAPTAPRLLRANVGAGRVVTLAWIAPEAGAATSYTLEAGTASGLANIVTMPLGAATSLQVTAPGGSFFIRVRAHNATGTSAPSNEVLLIVP